MPDDPGTTLRTQRLDTVDRIAEHAVERSLDAILVAGNIFDDNDNAIGE